MLRSLFEKPVALIRNRLRHQTIRSRFLETGWSVHEFYAGGFPFMLQREIPGSRSLRAAIQVGMPELSIFKNRLRGNYYSAVTHAQNCVGVFVVEKIPAQAIVKLAADSGLLFILLEEVDKLESSLHQFERQAEDHYRSIKHKLLRIDEANEINTATDQSTDDGGSRPIYASRHTECALLITGGSKLLVLFSGPEQDFLPIVSTARELNADLLTIRALAWNWFPMHDAEKWLSVVREALPSKTYDERFAIGIGQGGFGVLKYAAQLECQHAIGAPGVFSADPRDAPNSRYTAHFSVDLNYDMRLRKEELPQNILLIYDPYDNNDSDQAKMIMTTVEVQALLLPFVGPNLPAVIGEGPTFSAILSAYMMHDNTKLPAICASIRSRNPSRAFNMASSLAARRPETAYRIFEKHGLSEVRSWASVCFLLSLAGKAKQVIGHIAAEADRYPDDAELQAAAALTALDADDPEVAMRCISRAFDQEPTNKKYIWIRNRALDKQGSPQEFRGNQK